MQRHAWQSMEGHSFQPSRPHGAHGKKCFLRSEAKSRATCPETVRVDVIGYRRSDQGRSNGNCSIGYQRSRNATRGPSNGDHCTIERHQLAVSIRVEHSRGQLGVCDQHQCSAAEATCLCCASPAGCQWPGSIFAAASDTIDSSIWRVCIDPCYVPRRRTAWQQRAAGKQVAIHAGAGRAAPRISGIASRRWHYHCVQCDRKWSANHHGRNSSLGRASRVASSSRPEAVHFVHGGGPVAEASVPLPQFIIAPGRIAKIQLQL